MHVERPDKTV